MTTGQVTQVLTELRSGNLHAADKLLPLVYDQLRNLAQRYLSQERAGHTLQPTALVHEAYIRMVGNADWEDRAHFFAVAARAMRRILVDHARVRSAAKRGGGEARWPIEAAENCAERPDEYVVALDEALTNLAGIDPELARLVELRFFGGLSVEESADVLKVSVRTVNRNWVVAKGWLHRTISGET
ncbi:MAG: sigma-70 family RNA polymerase sigma factor [Planctomycetes bacterium]|nr:sigma-70 family RNA polymerase sigma factor [Planctomycetota bacterium]